MDKFKKIIVQIWPYAGLALVSLFLLYAQWFWHVTPMGGDTYFHYSRFYDTAMQIRNHNFNYFQLNYGFDQAGRMINAVYGPFFAYAMGCLVLLTHSWFRFKLVSSFLIVLIGAGGMYHLSWRLTQRRAISFLLALTYIGLTRVTDWEPVSNFVAISEMLAPYVFLCGIRMVTDHQRPINWLQLGITMAIVGQIHLLSCIIFTFALVPFLIMSLVINKKRKKIWLNLLAAVGLAILLTINIWLVLLHFFTVEKIINPFPMSLSNSSLNILLIPKSIGISVTWTFLLASLANGIYLVLHWQKDKVNDLIFCEGLIFFLLSTKLIPWGLIEHHFPFLQTSFQNPKRFWIVSNTLLILSLGLTICQLFAKNLNNNQELHSLLIIALSVVMMSGFTKVISNSQFYTYCSHFNPYSRIVNNAALERNLDAVFHTFPNVPSPDYLPKHHEISSERAQTVYQHEVVQRKQEFRHKVLPKGKLQISWINHTHQIKRVKLPIVLYRESQLKGKAEILKVDAIGVPTVKERPGKNRAVLSFNEPNWFKPSMIIVLICWVLALVTAVCQRIKFTKNLSAALT